MSQDPPALRPVRELADSPVERERLGARLLERGTIRYELDPFASARVRSALAGTGRRSLRRGSAWVAAAVVAFFSVGAISAGLWTARKDRRGHSADRPGDGLAVPTGESIRAGDRASRIVVDVSPVSGPPPSTRGRSLAPGAPVPAGRQAAPLARDTEVRSDASSLAAGLDCASAPAGSGLGLCTATYLGGAHADSAAGVRIARDGTIVFAGVIGDNDFHAPVTTLLQGGEGAILRLAPSGQRVLSVSRLGKEVTGLDLDARSGNIVVTGDFGAAVLDPLAQRVLWVRHEPGAAGRVSAGRDGVIAVMDRRKQIHMFSESGQVLGRFSIDVEFANDVAVATQSRAVLVTGTRVRGGRRMCGKTLPIAFLAAYTYDGQPLWEGYDHTTDEIVAKGGGCGGSQGIRVMVGPDDKAYFAGAAWTSGWIFSRDPLDLDRAAPHAAFDSYSRIDAIEPSAGLSYVARIAPATGAVEAGQFVVARHARTGLGNSTRILAMAADEQGNLSVAGSAACCIPGRDSESYRGGDAFVMVLPRALDRRLAWITLSEQGTGSVVDMAVGRGLTAVVANQKQGPQSNRFVIRNALQPGPAGGLDAFLSILRSW